MPERRSLCAPRLARTECVGHQTLTACGNDEHLNIEHCSLFGYNRDRIKHGEVA